MTVSATTPRVKYNGSGSTGPFSIPFYWLNSTELVVTKTSSAGVESTLVVTTNYTVTGAGTDTGALTLITTLAVGETLTIERATTQTQGVDLARSVIDPEILEGALDKLTRHAQDLWHNVTRSLRLYKDDTTGSGVYNAGGQRIGNLADGVDPTDAATLAQVEVITGALSEVEAAAAEAEASAIQAAFYADLAEGVAAGSVLPQTFALSGIITPSIFTANQNDFNPSGLSTSTVLRLSTDQSRDLTGLAGGSEGRMIIIHNVGSNALVIKDSDAASTAANRFALSSDVTLAPDQSALLQYDNTTLRWRMIGGTGGSGGGGVTAGTAPPSFPLNGDLWYDTNNGILYMNLDDGSTTQWVEPTGSVGISDNAILDTKLRDSAALSVIGRSANSTGDPADIVAASDGQVLRRSGTSIGFGTVATAGIADDAITNAKLADVATSTIKGRLTASTGDPEDLTPEQAQLVLGTQPFDAENKIINGAFDFWQRGTSSTSGGYQTADRWTQGNAGGTVTQSRQSFAVGDALGRNIPKYYFRQSVSGQTLASHSANFGQSIESVGSYAGQTITVLGWAKRSSGTGNMALEFIQSFGTGGSPSASVDSIGVSTITLTGSWAPFAVTVNVPSITGKTLGTNNDDKLFLAFWTSAGSDYNSRTNSLGLQTIGVDLWGVHIRAGTHTAAAAANYIAPDLGPELARCQRYYTVIEANAHGGVGVKYASSAAALYFNGSCSYPVQMRADPTSSTDTTPTYSNCGTLEILVHANGLTQRVTTSAAGTYRAYGHKILLDAEL